MTTSVPPRSVHNAMRSSNSGDWPSRTRRARRPMRSSVRRTLLALLASALTAVPLRGLLSDSGWLLDVWLSMIVVIGPAVLLRLRRQPGALDIWPGVVLLVLWLTARFVPQHAWLGFIPTPGAWHDVGALMTSLHETTRDEVAPVHSTMAIRLVLSALLALLAALIDLIAVVGRRGALAGVPMLVVYTVSGAVPRHPVSWLWFLFAGIGFVILLGLDSADQLQRWGQRVGRRGAGGVRVAASISAPRVGVAAILVAILLPLAVPADSRNLIANAFHHSHGGSGAIGLGTGGISPFADLRGELTRSKSYNVVTVHIDHGDASVPPFYLKTGVLDYVTQNGWQESDRGETESLRTTEYATDPPSTQPTTRLYQATITVDDLTGTAPIFSLPLRIAGLAAGTLWSPRDQILLGTHVRPGEKYTETFAQPAPTRGDLDDSVGDIPADMSRWLQLPKQPSYVTDLVSKLVADKTRPYDRARAISDYFSNPANNFQYTLKTKLGDSGSELVDFLKNRKGFCQQYAAAMAIMLRQAGVPARVALGYEHQAPDVSGNFTVTTYDAHAWVEAYFKNIGWLPFDPTPIAGLEGGSQSDISYAPHVYPSTGSSGNSNSKPHNSASNSATTPTTSAAPSSSAPAVAATSPGGPTDTTPIWVALAVLVVLAIMLTPAGARFLRRRRRLAAGRTGDADALWAELADTAVDLGYRWSTARSPRQVADWLRRDVGTDHVAALTALATAVEQRRYSRTTPDHAPELVAALVAVTGQLRRRRSAGTRLRGLLVPASLNTGGQRVARPWRWMSATATHR